MTRRTPAELGSARFFNEAVEEAVNDLWPLLEDLADTMLGELDDGYAPGVEPDDSLRGITAARLAGMGDEVARDVLSAMASDPRQQRRAARLAAQYLDMKYGGGG